MFDCLTLATIVFKVLAMKKGLLCLVLNDFTIAEQELEDVMGTLGDGEDDRSVLKRDAVFAHLNFCLNTGSLRVVGNSTDTSTGQLVVKCFSYCLEIIVLKLKYIENAFYTGL